MSPEETSPPPAGVESVNVTSAEPIKDVDLDSFITSLLSSGASVKPKGSAKGPAKPAALVPEVADALLLIAVKVSCRSCGSVHIGSSHVMRRIPRRDGTVYKPVIAPVVEDLPRIVQWAFEDIDHCWRCFDLLQGPYAKDLGACPLNPQELGLVPERNGHAYPTPRCLTAEEQIELENFHLMMKTRIMPLPPETAFRFHELKRLQEIQAPAKIEVLEPEELAYRSTSDTFLNEPKEEKP